MIASGRFATALPWALVVVVSGVSLWLYRDNRRLTDALASQVSAAGRGAEASGEGADDPWARPASAGKGDGPAAPTGMWKALTRNRAAPELPDAAPKESRAERRVRRQLEIAAMLGRLDGETVDEYRARMVPFIEAGLSGPRQRLEEARAAAEAAAQVSDEQRQELDKIFADSFDEVVSLTNEAVSGGELTPYERNWSGMLNYAGGLGAILGATEGRVGQVLTPGQQQTIYELGFEWGEYLGTKVPWESIEPPPPPPGGGG